MSAGAERPEACWMARSSISAGTVSKVRPASASSICRARLCDANINESFPHHSVILQAVAAACR